MKKLSIIPIVFLLAFSILFVGCQSKNTEGTTTPSENFNSAIQNPDIDNTINKPYKETDDFGFTLICYDSEFVRGNYVSLNAEITNLTDETILTRIDGPNVIIRLFHKTTGNRENFPLDEYTIYAREIPVSDIITPVEFPPNEKALGSTHYFFIPEHALSGKYSVKCSFKDSTVVFEDVFTLD